MGGVLYCNVEDTTLTSDHHSGDHHDSSADTSHHHSNDSNDHHSTNDSAQECCDNQSEYFFSGLVKQEQTVFSFAKNLQHFNIFSVTDFSILHQTSFLKIKVNFILNNLPPPKIFDIRIFIQSFLN